MREWILERQMTTEEELKEIEAAEEQHVLDARDRAWDAFRSPIEHERETVVSLLEGIGTLSPGATEIHELSRSLREMKVPLRRDIMAAATEALLAGRNEPPQNTALLIEWVQDQEGVNRQRYSSHRYSESAESALKVRVIPARYAEKPTILKGFEIINA
jgi:hypothetical protein